MFRRSIRSRVYRATLSTGVTRVRTQYTCVCCTFVDACVVICCLQLTAFETALVRVTDVVEKEREVRDFAAAAASTRDEVELPLCAVLPDLCQNYAPVIVCRVLLSVANFGESGLCFGNVRFDPRVH